jgi:hypothetical protein
VETYFGKSCYWLARVDESFAAFGCTLALAYLQKLCRHPPQDFNSLHAYRFKVVNQLEDDG